MRTLSFTEESSAKVSGSLCIMGREEMEPWQLVSNKVQPKNFFMKVCDILGLRIFQGLPKTK